jgi:hypothetical protein
MRPEPHEGRKVPSCGAVVSGAVDPRGGRLSGRWWRVGLDLLEGQAAVLVRVYLVEVDEERVDVLLQREPTAVATRWTKL